MDDNTQKSKSNIHIHLGGLVLIIIIGFILFKVNIKSYINSPEFQSNISYIEEKGQSIWDKYLSKYFHYVLDNLIFGNVLNNGISKLKNSAPDLKLPIDQSTTLNKTFKLDELKNKLGTPSDLQDLKN